LYALLLANLLTDPRLEDVVRPRVLDLAGAIRHDGASMSDWFATDCDSTAVTFAVVLGGGCRPNRDALQRFAGRDGAFMTYPGELQHSISAMGHAAHTLSLLDEDPLPTLDYLAKYRTSDGRWIADKWHASWIYLTSHILAAQICAGRAARSQASLQTLIDHQRPDGSWGATTAVYEETAHSVLALLAFDAVGALPEHGRQSLQQAAGWLIQMYRPLVEEMTICWIGKELYSPHRVARAFVTSATLACILRGYGL
jgi:halimadienyl-diphosphate synthase